MTRRPGTGRGIDHTAVANFLASLNALGAVEAFANLRADAASSGWNSATVDAIARGISRKFGDTVGERKLDIIAHISAELERAQSAHETAVSERNAAIAKAEAALARVVVLTGNLERAKERAGIS